MSLSVITSKPGNRRKLKNTLIIPARPSKVPICAIMTLDEIEAMTNPAKDKISAEVKIELADAFKAFFADDFASVC